MASEKERKFLVQGNIVPTQILQQYKGRHLMQGYLMLDGTRQLRVRTIDNSEAYICFKAPLSPEEKSEFEYPIPFHDALELMQLCKCTISKERYSYSSGDLHFDIDKYIGIDLVVCEIEYKDELTAAGIPAFCTDEVTGNNEYSNIVLAMRNESTIL